jgi:predicted  nucleic acid-binding Zn-ribbon protein
MTAYYDGPDRRQNGSNYEAHFLAHDQMIKQNSRDIEIIYKAIDGLPTEVRSIKESVVGLREDIKDFKELMSKLEGKVVSKEILEVLLKSLNDKIDNIDECVETVEKDVDKRLKKLEDDYKWVLRGLIVGIISILVNIIKEAAAYVFKHLPSPPAPGAGG